MINPLTSSTSNVIHVPAQEGSHLFGVADVPTAATIWDYLPSRCVFARWVQQLQRAVRMTAQPQSTVNSTDPCPDPVQEEAPSTIWDLVGHGVVIEHTDPQEAAALLPLVAEASGMDYWEVEHDKVVGTFDEWKQLLSEGVPTLIHLCAGHWVADSSQSTEELDLPRHPSDSPADAASFRAALAREMATCLAGRPVVVVVAVKDSGHVAPELLGARRLERQVALPELDDATHGRVFIAQCAYVKFSTALLGSPSEVGAVVRRHKLRDRLDFAQALRRLVWQEGRPASLRDVIECDVHGTSEEDLGAVSQAMRWTVAVHEAGHALVGYLASEGRYVPAYCSIGSRRKSAGLVMPSYDMIQRSERGEDTFADKLQRLRVMLAGRCAEHVVLGPDQISAGGAGSDMESASRLAMKMMGSLGLPVKAADDADMAGNLLVIIGNPIDCEVRDCSDKARSLLREQYLHVLHLLRSNRHLLLKLARELTKQSVLLQDDLRRIMGGGKRAPGNPAASIHALLKAA